jgi:hypothetical protein
MQIHRSAKKIDCVQNDVQSTKNTDICEDNWKKLDEGLIKIEKEWKKRMITEQYLNEFIPKSLRIIDDIDDFTVDELKCWHRLLNTEFEDDHRDLYFKNMDRFYYSEIHIIYWFWLYNDKKYILIDISFKIENDSNFDVKEYGAIFLNNDVVLINSEKSLYKTDNTSIELEKRIFSFESIR